MFEPFVPWQPVHPVYGPLASVAKPQRVTVGKPCWPAAKPSLARWQPPQPVSPASAPVRRCGFALEVVLSSIDSLPWLPAKPPAALSHFGLKS